MNGNRQVFCLSMVGVVTIVAMLFTSALAEHKYRNKQKMVEEEFALQAGGALDIDVEDMDVEVKKATGNTSRVTVFVAGDDEDRAAEYFNEHMTFETRLDGNTLRIESSEPGHESWRFWQRYRNIDVWAVVEVPIRIDANIRTDDGDLEIEELNGKISLRTSDGDVRAPVLSGPSILIRSEDGDIIAKTLTADNEIEIDTSDGDLFCRTISGARVVLATSDGNVEVEHITGRDIEVSVSDGDIELGVEGARLSASCDDGDMMIHMFSDMEVDLSTRDGDIDLRVPQTMAADLELFGEDVRVSRGISISGRVSDTRVVGTMNNGGKKIKASTHDGAISVSGRSNSK